VYLPGLELRSTHRGDAETERLQVMTAGEAGRAQVRVLHWTSGRPDGISNDQVRYSHDNLTGSSGLEVDGDGRVISMEEYYPYGGTAVWTARSAAEADYRTVRHSGKERDATGLYYYGYRYCQPWSGRWLSADPAGTVDGLNLFRMCRNNPVTLKDSDGRMQEPANQTFSGYIGRDEFSVFDKLLKFPELFYESEDNPSSLAGNIHEENVAEGERSHQKKISVVWGREVTPHFQPKHPSEIAPDGGISLAFIQDISRATYTISFAPADEGMKFTKEDIDKIFSPQAKQVISTIAHQGHLADITIELYGILPVDDMNRFVQKRGNMPEHRIFNEGGQYRITSIKQFEFKNSDTEEYDEISGFTATVEQTTYLDAKGFDGSGNRILSYQSMDKPSFQKISLTMILPENPGNQPVVPAGKGFFSRRRNK
ncbi:TPA: RHS repeat-associated core domain-containing protein, partial [Enterobacter ludwigii]